MVERNGDYALKCALPSRTGTLEITSTSASSATAILISVGIRGTIPFRLHSVRDLVAACVLLRMAASVDSLEIEAFVPLLLSERELDSDQLAVNP